MERIVVKVKGQREGEQYFEVYQMELFNPYADKKEPNEIAVYRNDYGCCREDLDNVDIITENHSEYEKAIAEIDNAKGLNQIYNHVKRKKEDGPINYKEEMLAYIKAAKEAEIEEQEEKGHSTDAIEKAYDLTYKIIKNRFEIEIKQYNGVEERACDEFIANKNLNYLQIYIEEFLLIDKEESQIEFYKVVRKQMRKLMHAMRQQIL